jgi:hypothetical protein
VSEIIREFCLRMRSRNTSISYLVFYFRNIWEHASFLLGSRLRHAVENIGLLSVLTITFAGTEAAGDELTGRWADSLKSCEESQSTDPNELANFEIIDFDHRKFSFFDAPDCPMTEFVPKSEGLDLATHVFRAYCRGEEGDGPPFWLFVSRDGERISVTRLELPASVTPVQGFIIQCPKSENSVMQTSHFQGVSELIDMKTDGAAIFSCAGILRAAVYSNRLSKDSYKAFFDAYQRNDAAKQHLYEAMKTSSDAPKIDGIWASLNDLQIKTKIKAISYIENGHKGEVMSAAATCARN